MSQQEKNEATTFAGETFLNTLWGQYDTFVSRTRKQMETTEAHVKENQQELIKLQRESLTAWWNLQEEFVAAAREGQRAWVRTVEGSFRPFFSLNG